MATLTLTATWAGRAGLYFLHTHPLRGSTTTAPYLLCAKPNPASTVKFVAKMMRHFVFGSLVVESRSGNGLTRPRCAPPERHNQSCFERATMRGWSSAIDRNAFKHYLLQELLS